MIIQIIIIKAAYGNLLWVSGDIPFKNLRISV